MSTDSLKNEILNVGVNGKYREYRVLIKPDEENRRKAINYFDQGLIALPSLPDYLHEMPQHKAQAYLDKNPVSRICLSLRIDHKYENELTNDILINLRWLPELEVFTCNWNGLTNTGVENIKSLTNLKYLSLSSSNINDNCLTVIQNFEKLEILSVQNCSLITPKAIEVLRGKMPNLEVYQ